ncbi:MAG: hypothetical protein ACR2G6_15955 [Gemmatimonadaceae bacterium]
MSTLSPVIARRIVMAALWRREDAQILQAVPASAFPLELQELWRIAIANDAKGLGRFHLRIRPSLDLELGRRADQLFHERGDELSIMAEADARNGSSRLADSGRSVLSLVPTEQRRHALNFEEQLEAGRWRASR